MAVAFIVPNYTINLLDLLSYISLVIFGYHFCHSWMWCINLLLEQVKSCLLLTSVQQHSQISILVSLFFSDLISQQSHIPHWLHSAPVFQSHEEEPRVLTYLHGTEDMGLKSSWDPLHGTEIFMGLKSSWDWNLHGTEIFMGLKSSWDWNLHGTEIFMGLKSSWDWNLDGTEILMGLKSWWDWNLDGTEIFMGLKSWWDWNLDGTEILMGLKSSWDWNLDGTEILMGLKSSWDWNLHGTEKQAHCGAHGRYGIGGKWSR